MWLAYAAGVTNGAYSRYWTRRKLGVSKVQEVKRAVAQALSRLPDKKS